MSLKTGTCSKCGDDLDGSHASYCKACFAAYMKARYEADPEKHRQRRRDWREAHPGYDAELQRIARARNPECWNEYHRQWRVANPESRQRTRRMGHLRSNYGLSIPEFEALPHAQDNKCPMCRKELTIGGRSNTSAHIDHDHQTGEVRAILCARCNNGLGCFQDNVDTLIGAIEYLTFFKKE